MDVEYPYADGASRRLLLYRLPTAPAPRRLLLVGDPAEAELIANGWAGAVTVLASTDLPALASKADAGFDAVALPSLLGWQPGPGAAAVAAAPLLRHAHRVLAPGGVVVGHCENIRTLRRLASLRGLVEIASALARRGAVDSPSRCHQALGRAGFTAIECYYVQPNIDSPMGLIPCERGAARAQFLRAVRSARGQYGPSAYALRWLVAFLGLGGMKQPQLFFWARKAC